MPQQKVRFTREQLYELVWSKPMTDIAEVFGMSSVAFAKHCEKLDVPRPGRGHWQQLAAGYKPKPDPLPKLKPGVPSYVEITRHEKRPAPPETDPAPRVSVGDSLRKPHPALAKLQEKLRGPTGRDIDSVRGDGHAVFSASGPARKRGLLILDALFKQLDARGHDVRFGDARYAQERHALFVIVAEKPPIELWLTEHLDRSDHVPTEAERKQKEKYSWSSTPKYDYANSGRLILEIDVPWESGLRKRWADGKKQRLEELLGDIVVGIERAAEASRIREERREAERQEERRRREELERAERRAAHRKALGDDLVKMATAWNQAETTREFLAAVAARVPPKGRTSEFEAWLAWAATFVDGLDPLHAPERIAKALEPVA